MIDIEKLKLTDEEARKAWETWRPRLARNAARDVADAQLAKALWGLVDGRDWELCDASWTCQTLEEIEKALEAAGIPRPEKENHEGHTDCAACGTTTG